MYVCVSGFGGREIEREGHRRERGMYVVSGDWVFGVVGGGFL